MGIQTQKFNIAEIMSPMQMGMSSSKTKKAKLQGTNTQLIAKQQSSII
jgi:hypothetical protein